MEKRFKSSGIATINDVAEFAGVSKRTVSRVINNSSKVNPITRERILAAIQSLNFSPNAQARGLASRRSYLLGLLFNDMNAAVLHPVQKGLLRACEQSGYELIVKPVQSHKLGYVDQIIQFVKRTQLEGLILLPPIANDEKVIEALGENDIPYIRFGARLVDDEANMVVSLDREAMGLVAALFEDRAVSTVGIISGPLDRIASEERLEGLRTSLTARGFILPDEYVVYGDFSYNSGREAALTLLSLEDRPDAIFAANDQMAIGAMQQAQQMGLGIPQDLLVVGYDNDSAASLVSPSLTTLARPNEDMAEAAAHRLLARLNGSSLEAAPLNRFLPKLIERESTARPV
jgi:LacI family transcriptional regulator